MKRPRLVLALVAAICVLLCGFGVVGWLSMRYGEGAELRPGGPAPWERPWSPQRPGQLPHMPT